MKTIYKYEIKVKDQQKIKVVGFRNVLKVAEQNGELFMWCYIETLDKEITLLDVYVVGTGHEIRQGGFLNNYIDSVIMSNGLVWHIAID